MLVITTDVSVVCCLSVLDRKIVTGVTLIIGYRIKLPTSLMTSFNLMQTTSTCHRITKNNRLDNYAIWAKCLKCRVGDLPEWVGFRPHSLHVNSCSGCASLYNGRQLTAHWLQA